jgi:predicted outer membrane lipoprotein
MNALAITGEITTDPQNIQAGLVEAALRWGEIELKQTPGMTRDQRLNVRALAEAFGIPFTDQNDGLPGGRLTAAEVARLPALRRSALFEHFGKIVLFRTMRMVRHPFRRGNYVDDGIFRRLFRSSVLKSALTIAALYVLIGVLCGFASPIEFSRYIFALGVAAYGWALVNPDFMWKLTRLLAGFAAFGILIALWARYENGRDRGIPVAPIPAAAPARRYEIENFRERSAFGDASLAQKREVARALLGSGGDFAPKFED